MTGGILIKGDEADAVRALSARSPPASTGSTPPRSTATARRKRRSAAICDSLTPQPYVSTKVRHRSATTCTTSPARSSAAWSKASSACDLDRVALFQLHNHLGDGVGDRLALPPEQVLGRGGVADTFDRLKEQGLFYACGITAAGDTAALPRRDQQRPLRLPRRSITTPSIRARPGRARRRNWRAQDFSGIMAACFHQNMGILNIRVWAGGPLAKPARPERLFVMTSGTDVDNEMRCAAAVRAALGDGLRHAGAGRAALRARQPRLRDAADRHQRCARPRRGARGGGGGAVAGRSGRQARTALGQRISSA